MVANILFVGSSPTAYTIIVPTEQEASKGDESEIKPRGKHTPSKVNGINVVVFKQCVK